MCERRASCVPCLRAGGAPVLGARLACRDTTSLAQPLPLGAVWQRPSMSAEVLSNVCNTFTLCTVNGALCSKFPPPLPQHQSEYELLLTSQSSSTGVKRLAASFVVKFSPLFPSLVVQALDCLCDLLEDEDSAVRGG